MQLTVPVTEEVRVWLRSESKRRKITQGELIALAVAAFKMRENLFDEMFQRDPYVQGIIGRFFIK